MKKIKNKKTLIILLVLCIGLVGITIAYFSNSTTIDNLFSTKEYGTTYTETFISPDNWLPGDTTDKTLVVTNSGEVDEAVRISYTEVWKSNNGTTLSGLIDENGKLTDEEENSEKAAIINFSNTDDWTYNNGYYYYNYKLAPSESTSSFIESVTFNPNVTLGDTCTETESNGVKTVTCSSSGDDYDNATYKLTLKIETVQYNKYMSAWNTDVAIANEQSLFCDAFEVGEVVDYNGSEYYVLKDSSTSDDYVTLLKKDPLTAEEVNQYSTSYVSQDGEYPYYENDTCNENIQTGCSTNYDTSDVKKIIDGWSSSFSDDLAEIDGYKVGLINEDIFNDYYEYKLINPTQQGYYLKNSNETNKYIFFTENAYWISFVADDSNINIYKLGKYEPITEKIYNKSYIRPVINLKKNVIENTCFHKKTVSLYCTEGEIVTYNGDNYYVLSDSKFKKKYVTLLKKDPLTAEEVNSYSTDYVSQDGEYPFYENYNCNANDESGCVVKYDNSNVKSLIDSWSNNLKNDLVKKNGYKVYLLNYDNFESLGYEFTHYSAGMYNYKKTDETPEWAYIEGKPFWTMERYSDYSNKAYYISDNLLGEDVYNKLYIRPVINLKKSAIESGCSKNGVYLMGRKITYNDTNYYVMENSSSDKDYVTLLKAEPLTYDEAINYKGNLSDDYFENSNNIGYINYYKNSKCYSCCGGAYYRSDCNSNYENSYIKVVVDNWSNSNINNDHLVEINGYKTRLVTENELFENLGYERAFQVTINGYWKTEFVPDWVNGNYSYWTMSPAEDSESLVYNVGSRDLYHTYVYNSSAIRPVINLKKCAITNTCE